MTHLCVSKLTIIGSDNGFSPGRCQAIIYTNPIILLTGPLETNFSEILILMFSAEKIYLKISSVKWRSFCLNHNVLSTNSILGNIEIYLNFLSFLNITMVQVVEIFFIEERQWCILYSQ